MIKTNLIKLSVVAIVLLIGLIGFSCSYESAMTISSPSNTPEKILDATSEIADFKNWTKVNKEPKVVHSKLAAQCAEPTKEQIEKEATNLHNDKYINVYVNEIGKGEMLNKTNPNFPVGTVIVKEKLSTAESKDAELLTVMIKRERNYNPKVGDWEFLTFNGAGTETTARGKLENCQTCHLVEKSTDYVSRHGYLPVDIWRKLK